MLVCSYMYSTELEPCLLPLDIAGGCGSMYKISVVSPEFAGKNMVAQHKMVTTILKTEISEMHGLTIKTKVRL